MIEKSFKVTIYEDSHEKRVIYTNIGIELTDFKNEKPFCIKRFLKERELPSKEHEIYWIDDEQDVVLIKTWSDLYNYVMHIVPDGVEHIKLYIRKSSVEEGDAENDDVSDEENE